MNGKADFDLSYYEDDLRVIFGKKKEVYDNERMVYIRRMYMILFIQYF